MNDLLLKRYLWLVDTLRSRGEMTFNQLADAWRKSVVNEDHVELSQRTLYNHCQGVERVLDIKIVSKKGRSNSGYSLENPDILKSNRVVGWMLDTFATSNYLASNSDMADKILLEEIPQGRMMLPLILDSIRQCRVLKVNYLSYFGNKITDSTFKPLCVKLFRRRWYVIGLLNDASWPRNLALDRILNLQSTDETFIYPPNFDAQTFFEPYFGIFTPEGGKKEKVRLKAYRELPHYLVSLPLHSSQRVVKRTPEYTEFRLNLIITPDLVQEILIHYDQLEVLEPESLRNQIKEQLQKTVNLYDNPK